MDFERLTVGIWFAGQVTGGRLVPADDLDQVAFFPLDALPAPLAFPTSLSFSTTVTIDQ